MDADVPEKWKRLAKKLKEHWDQIAKVDIKTRTGSATYKPLESIARSTIVDDDDEDTGEVHANSLTWDLIELAEDFAAEKGPRIDVEIIALDENGRKLFREARQVIAGDGDSSAEQIERSLMKQMAGHIKDNHASIEKLSGCMIRMGEGVSKLLESHSSSVGKLGEAYSDAWDFAQERLDRDMEAATDAIETQQTHETIRHFGALIFEFGLPFGDKKKKGKKDGANTKPSNAIKDVVKHFRPVEDAIADTMGKADFRTFKAFIDKASDLDDDELLEETGKLAPIFEAYGAELMLLANTPLGLKFIKAIKVYRDSITAYADAPAAGGDADPDDE